MPEVVNVRFRSKGKAYFFDPAGTTPRIGDSVIVETAKGLEFGECVRGAHYVEETAIVPPLRPVIRIATDDDKAVAQANKEREKTAFDFCQKKIAERGLEMKLVDVEYSFDGSKILFFFTSDGRVDFRELVKDLASVFRTRIELRQIGVRDSAKLVGGLGICGRPFCCSSFLEDFQPVSIKMAKTQSLSLNPTKISGTCGRLMCCLKYEQDAYEHLLKTVPKVETEVDTPEGKGTVKEVNLLRRTVKVKLAEESITELRSYPARELGFTVGGVYKEPEPPEEEPEDIAGSVSSRRGFGRIDPMPALINDKPQEREEKPEQQENEGKNRHRGGRRHRSKKPQSAQNAQPDAEKNEPPKQETQNRQEKQGQQKNQPNRQKSKGQQPKQEQQEKQNQQEKPSQQSGAQHSSHRRGNGGKPQQEKREQQPKTESHQQVMDDKAKARAAAVAAAVAQAKPNANKRNYHRRHKANKPSGEKTN
ncbi:MAG: regulatory iron-sulfur-containing complex subunit RicT [Clostridiales bacterium]|nr:regulatory iron-sulfur-containing complex subunit RicT [Clostridiales bacterium]